MKLEIHEQPRLSIAKQIELTVDGLQYRWGRSAVTLSVVILAVAFLMNTLAEHVVATSCRSGLTEQTRAVRELAWLSGMLTSRLNETELQAQLADPAGGTWTTEPLAAWMGIAPQDLSHLREQSRVAQDARTWFDELRPGHQRLLVGKLTFEQAMERLEDPAERQRVHGVAREIPLTLPAQFFRAIEEHQPFRQSLQEVVVRRNQAVGRLGAQMGGRSLGQRLASAGKDEPGRAALTADLAAAGLRLSGDRLEGLIEQAGAEQQTLELQAMLASPAVVRAWPKEQGGVFEQGKAMEGVASDESVARWVLKQAGLPVEQAGTIRQTAGRLVENRRANEVREQLRANYGDREGLGARTFWLIVVSLLVCIAGISNAMLISVIERFREIATMKCLGALNGFIATLFMLEAACLGLVGGMAGVLLGAGIGIVRMFLGYGRCVGTYFPWGDILSAAGLSAGCGVLLAMLAAAYPAYMASRMPPVEAMRVE